MSLYSTALFLHIVGALGLFASIALEQTSLSNLRRARSGTQARDWLMVLGGLRRIDAPSGLAILLTGFYMMAASWGRQAWIGLSLLAMVVMAVLGIAVTGRRLRRIINTPHRDVSAIDDRALRVSATLRAAIALGVVFNMAVKPGAVGALTALVIALGAGLLVGLTAARRTTERGPVPMTS